MKNFLRIFSILTRKQMLICFFLIFLMCLCAMMEAIGIGLVYPLIRVIGSPNFLEEHQEIAGVVQRFGVTTHRRLIFFSSISLLFFYVFKNLVILYEGKLQIAFSMNNQKDYVRRLYSYYMSKPYIFLLNTNISIMQRNICSGGTIVFCNILISALSIITELITILVIWLFLAAMDLLTALGVAFVIAPFVIAILNFFRKRIGACGAVQAEYSAEMGKWVNQGFGSIKETRVMQLEDFFTEKFCGVYSKYTDSARDFQFMQRVPRSIIELAAIGGILLLIAVKMLL